MKKLNFLKSFMLVIAAFACVALAGTAKVAAADDPVDAVAPTGITVTYDATLDVLKLNNSETEAVKCLVYVCKDAEAKVFDASKATKVTVPASGSANVTLTKVGSTKAMADIKINKTGYVFVGTVVTGKVNVTPNFVINPTACKKLDVTINYNSINATDNTAASAIASAKYVDLNGESQAVTDVNNNLEYSTDGKAWSAASGFTGEKLATLVTGAATGKKTVYFRLKGTTGATTVATRPSAAKKYSIAKQAKAPSIKLDIAKSTLNIKNGMEYKIDKGSVDAAGAFTASAADTWHVILRTNKDGAATSSEVAGATYVPVKFDRNDDTTKANYTTVKVKSKAFDAATAFGTAAAVKISVRTAATEKKPASAAFEMVVLKPAAAPAVATDGIKNNNDNLKISFSGSAALEYVILPSLADVDWSSVKWSKYQAGSFKITAKTKTAKYSTTDDTAVDAAAVEAGNVLLVRIAGTKQSKTKTKIIAPVLPSAYKRINITAVTGDDAPEIGLKLVDPDASTPAGE